MSIPYEMPPAAGLPCPGGSASCHQLKFASRGEILKIIVKQTSGVMVDFTAALFNHEGVCEGNSLSESVGDYTGDLPADLYRVTPDLESTDAGTLIHFADKLPYVFVGLDADRLGKSRNIYIRITPEGSGAKMFAVALNGLTFGD